jgi:hypothetical protein
MIHASDDIYVSDYILSDYAKHLLESTCCHLCQLWKDGKNYWGIYNGLSYWGRIEDGKGNEVERVYCQDPDYDDLDEDGNYYEPSFTPDDFARNGYIVENG